MKTKLLCLLLFVTFGTFAQINVSESFETQFPAGWSTTGQSAGFSRGTSSYACDQSYTMTAGLHSSNNHAMVVTSNYVSDGNSIVVSFQYNRGIGAIAGNVYLYYDINNAESWQQIATSSDLSPGCKTLYGTISGNLVPTGSNVRFRMQINSTSGVSVFIDNFNVSQEPFAFEYTFDNTRNNTDGLFPFTATNTLFVADRNSNPDSAMQINVNTSGSQAVISLLPKNNASRTFSLWYKTSSNLNANVFTYGTACQDCNFGTYLGANGNPVFQSYISDVNFGGSYPANTWHHIVVTYSGTHVKMYMNGVLIGMQAYALVTGNNSYFRLGGNASTLTVDDLKMYDRELSASEVSNLFNHNQTEDLVPPVISNISSTTTSSTATITYTIDSTVGLATSVIKYAIIDTNLNSQVTGFSANGSVTNSITINGLLPNTEYYYQIEATNNDGIVSSSFEGFTTVPEQAIAEYSFDNIYTNLNGNSPFESNAGTSFTTDRHGNSNSAINVLTYGTTAIIPNLHYGNNPRTVSVWIKRNQDGSFGVNHIYHYGTATSGFDLSVTATTMNSSADGSNQHIATGMTNSLNVWEHYVNSFDGTTSKLYKNGVLLSTATPTWVQAVNNSDIFKLGLSRSGGYGFFEGSIDDLKIYNYVLTDTEISNLYNYNSLATEDFSLNNNVKLYPNPVRDILNIETNQEIQSVEIYNIQGQKVLSSNEKQINVSHLNSGIYLVKTQDSNNKISTNKIIIK